MDDGARSLDRFNFEAEVIYWRGPSPFFYAPIPPQHVERLRRAARAVTYGWGMVPVEVTIAGVAFSTALFPKDDTYLLPLKVAVRRKTNITAGDVVSVEMTVQPARR
jgi:ribosomal protein L25 (general stress protein Ctc)